MAKAKVNYKALSRTVETTLSPSLRRGLAAIATKTAHWGIKDQGDLALIMGVLNFGDPDHRVPNTPDGHPAPIPPRPWLNRSTDKIYQVKINKYVNDSLKKVVASIPKRGRSGFSASSKRAINPNDFMLGLAEIGRDNARYAWEKGNFAPNSDMTLRNKIGTKPLHDTGRMNASAITGWVD